MEKNIYKITNAMCELHIPLSCSYHLLCDLHIPLSCIYHWLTDHFCFAARLTNSFRVKENGFEVAHRPTCSHAAGRPLLWAQTSLRGGGRRCGHGGGRGGGGAVEEGGTTVRRRWRRERRSEDGGQTVRGESLVPGWLNQSKEHESRSS
jgi:hypothetical protein